MGARYEEERKKSQEEQQIVPTIFQKLVLQSFFGDWRQKLLSNETSIVNLIFLFRFLKIVHFYTTFFCCAGLLKKVPEFFYCYLNL